MSHCANPDRPGERADPVLLDPIHRALDEIARGRPVIVVDDEDRENEGDLILAASKATPETIAFMIRHTSGVLCAPLPGSDLDRLRLPPMTSVNEDPKATAYTVSVDARHGITTGISAADRAYTLRVLAEPATVAEELTRPGHVFPLRARDGGVLARAGHTEAAVDLTRLAGVEPAGVISELVNDDGTMARLPELVRFGRTHGLAVVSIADLIHYRRRTEVRIRRSAMTVLPTRYGEFRAIGYRRDSEDTTHLALVMGDLGDGHNVLVRVHSECLTGDVLGSSRCDCGLQLAAAERTVAEEGRGVVIYLRGHEGRGIGLTAKLLAYGLQDLGYDTVDANLELGLPVDARVYDEAAHIIGDLGIRSVRLMTNNPMKRAGLEGFGVTVVEDVAMPTSVTAHNRLYLQTKRDRMHHRLPDLDRAEADGPPPALLPLHNGRP